MTDKSKTPAAEELTDADLDDVQGGMGNFEIQRVRSSRSAVKQTDSKGVVLSSESETTYLKSKRDGKGIILMEEQETI